MVILLILNILYVSYLAISLSLQHNEIHIQILAYYYTYVTPVYDVLFVITASSIYGYIFTKIYKNRKANERLRKSFSENTNVTKQKSSSVKNCNCFLTM